jgi:hypothetical protein
MSYLECAFHTVIEDARTPESWFVCLMERTCEYGGPEEGGYWINNHICQAFKEYPTEEAAQTAKEQVVDLAAELSVEARRSYGQMCLRQMDWLEARGLDADWLGEDDGPSEFYVTVCNEVPVYEPIDRSYS